MIMPVSLILDVLVAILLVVFIAYAMVLNRKLGMLRRDKTELEKLAATFGDSTVRAEDSIRNLKSTADDLQVRIAKAQALADDLAFLIDRGSSSADRLEETVRTARDTAATLPRAAVSDEPRPAARPAAEPATVEPAFMEAPRVGAGGGAGGAGQTLKAPRLDDEFDDADGRSDAERALLKALRTAR